MSWDEELKDVRPKIKVPKFAVWAGAVLAVVGLAVWIGYDNMPTDREIMAVYKDNDLGDKDVDLLIPRGKTLKLKDGLSFDTIKPDLAEQYWHVMDQVPYYHKPEQGKSYIWIAMGGQEKGNEQFEHFLWVLHKWLELNNLREKYEINVLVLDPPVNSIAWADDLFMRLGFQRTESCGVIFHKCIDNFNIAPLLLRNGDNKYLREWLIKFLKADRNGRINLGDIKFTVEDHEYETIPVPLLFLSDSEGKLKSFSFGYDSYQAFPQVKKLLNKKTRHASVMDLVVPMAAVIKNEGRPPETYKYFGDTGDWSRIAGVDPVVKFMLKISKKQKNINQLNDGLAKMDKVFDEAVKRAPGIKKCVEENNYNSEECKKLRSEPIDVED